MSAPAGPRPGAPDRVRALALLSGGLDSALAVRLVQRQGVDVVALHLEAPTACRTNVRAVADELGVPLVTREKGEAFLALVRHPRFGHGRHMNPCIDCRAYMFDLARGMLAEHGAAFLVTGEVLGQRPMSQTRAAIDRIDRASGMTGRVLRPLSAKLLPPTDAERAGWIDRESLGAISGRGRHEQLALAAALGLRDHATPGGGCLLTDPGFSEKLREYFAHTSDEAMRLSDVALLTLGRQIRVHDDLVIVLGRREEENRRLGAFVDARRWLVEPVDFTGPTALVRGPFDAAALAETVESIVRYARAPRNEHRVRVRTHTNERVHPIHACLAPGASVELRVFSGSPSAEDAEQVTPEPSP